MRHIFVLSALSIMAIACSTDQSAPVAPIPSGIRPSFSTQCNADAATCDQIFLAADSLSNSSDSVCQNIGYEALRRFWDPHAQNQFLNGSENFIAYPIADEELPSGHAPMGTGTSYIPSGYSNAAVMEMMVHNEATAQGRDADALGSRCH